MCTVSQREIISFHIGHAGVKIGSKFWIATQGEHDIDEHGVSKAEGDLPLYYSGIYFHENDKGRFLPRALFIDLDPATNDLFKHEPIGNNMRQENLVSGYTSAQNVFARGYYTDGNEILPIIEDAIFREIEKCDSLQGFNFFCSLGGGCGSGLGSLLISYIREVAPLKLLHVVPIIPSPKVSNIVVESYNTILALYHLANDAGLSICVDNEALFDICEQCLSISDPTLNDLNYLITLSILGLTASMRFPGQLNGDLNKINTALVPYPRLQFAMSSFAPLTRMDTWSYRSYSPRDLLVQNYSSSNWMAACPVNQGTYMSSIALYRGLASTYEIESSIKEVVEKNDVKNSPWVPDNISLSFCDIPQRGFSSCCTVIANNTAIQYLFKRIWEQYSVMFHRGGFLHWYYGDGMEKQDFVNAEENIHDLVQEYASYEADLDLDEIDDKFKSERKNFTTKQKEATNGGIESSTHQNKSNTEAKTLNNNVVDCHAEIQNTNIRNVFCFTKYNEPAKSSSAMRVRCRNIQS